MDDSLSQAALLLKQARLLSSRLERLTPDSAWARRASGCRGTVIRLTDLLEKGNTAAPVSTSPHNPDRETIEALERVLPQGFAILDAAARESLKNARGQAQSTIRFSGTAR